MNLGSAIRAAISAKIPRTSITEVAHKVGLTQDVFSNMINGRTHIPAELVVKIREILDLPASWPGNHGLTPFQSGERVSLAGTPMRPIPIAGNVSAGIGVSNVDPDARTIYVPERLSSLGGIGLVIEGESMVDRLFPADVAVFKPHSSPILRVPCLIKSEQGEYRTKIIYWESNEKQWWTSSYNPAFPPAPLGPDQIMGFLVGLYRYRGTRETIISDPEGLDLD